VNLITTQGLAMHDTKCCSGTCDQGRTCPARNIIDFQSRSELHRHFAPGAIEHHKARINWWGVATLTIIPASFGAAVVAVYWGGRALGAW
jgi:hypothetical protein